MPPRGSETHLLAYARTLDGYTQQDGVFDPLTHNNKPIMTNDRLLPLSAVRPVRTKARRAPQLERTLALDILMQAQEHWVAMARFRRDRERNKRYTYGDQWQDTILVDGRVMREEDYIRSQGNVPLKNNMIRRLVRNVLGVYRSQAKEPTCTARDREEQAVGETMSTILQYNMQLNRMSEVYARTMEDFLIGGFIVHRKSWGWRMDKMDCWTDYVSPNNFFLSGTMRDFRGWDVECLGEIHDISWGQLCGEFASSPNERAALEEIYRTASRSESLGMRFEEFGYSRGALSESFFIPSDPTLCRVIEVWRKELKPRYRCHDYNSGEIYKIDATDYKTLVEAVNRSRIDQGTSLGMAAEDIPLIEVQWFMDTAWCYYYLSPGGDVLRSGETPYAHKSHPYVFKAYPFVDGEIHSFVSDVIDQQRYTNRLITMYDWIMRSSSKGVLLVPEESISDEMSIEEIADEWSKFNGVIAFKAKAGVPLPQQIATNATNIGISELLSIQLKFFEDISGVHGALQGKSGYSGMSGSLYAQQAQNATTSLLDLLDSFSQFVVDAAYKDVKNIQQCYDRRRVINIAGKGKSIVYDPEKIGDVEFDLSIVESTSTPAYRQLSNEMLMEIWRSGQLPLELLLQHGDFPFADELLQSLKSQSEQIEAGQAPSGTPPELASQIQASANPEASALAQQYLAG